VSKPGEKRTAKRAYIREELVYRPATQKQFRITRKQIEGEGGEGLLVAITAGIGQSKANGVG
jgi:hypothetical protein